MPTKRKFKKRRSMYIKGGSYYKKKIKGGKITTRRKITFRKAVCSPKRKTGSYTCYTTSALKKLKDLWNARHPELAITSNNEQEIWRSLKNYMASACETEQCWLRQQFAKKNLGPELMNYTFAPLAPPSWKKNPRKWLNSLDIGNVMKQYEQKYPTFAFIGPSPIDFDKRLQYDTCVWDELCNFNLKKHISNGKNMIGIIFNVDPHDKPGAHWISLTVHIRDKYIMFFDSTGDPPQNEIKVLMKRIIEQGRQLGINFTKHINTQKHQKQNTECGIYSIYVLSELLQDHKTKDDFLSGNITDNEMFNLRKEIFNLTDGTISS